MADKMTILVGFAVAMVAMYGMTAITWIWRDSPWGDWLTTFVLVAAVTILIYIVARNANPPA